LNFTDINLYVVIILTIKLGIGVTLCFVGALITVATAFGNEHKKWAIICIALLPLTPVYCLLYRDTTRYPQKYLMAGVLLIVLTGLITLWLSTGTN
jgi:hypothetical protein